MILGMLSLTTAQIIGLISTYRYVIIFPIAFVEGPIIAVICGWLVGLGEINFLVVYFVLISANILGDIIFYAIGYWGGSALVRRWGKWLRLDLEQVEKMKNHFDNHGGKILLASKVTPHFAVGAVLAGAGLARYSFALFLRYCLITELLKTAILLLIGYYIGDAYAKIVVYLDYLGAFFSLLVAGLIVWVIVFFVGVKKLI